mmetsp:Transcript_31835/g.73889  ORF Transcript_31835/g.73889 Transcript_31835/m.73889 type:complete len:176 (-) Transcript_31835:27-554(-)
MSLLKRGRGLVDRGDVGLEVRLSAAKASASFSRMAEALPSASLAPSRSPWADLSCSLSCESLPSNSSMLAPNSGIFSSAAEMLVDKSLPPAHPQGQPLLRHRANQTPSSLSRLLLGFALLLHILLHALDHLADGIRNALHRCALPCPHGLRARRGKQGQQEPHCVLGRLAVGANA